jgi:hypothetical protein
MQNQFLELKSTFLHLVVTFVCRDNELVSNSMVLAHISHHLFKTKVMSKGTKELVC